MEITHKIPAPLCQPQPRTINDEQAKEQRHTKDAAHKFEVMLTMQLVHEMTNTMDGQSLLGSGVESRMFGSMVEWELAEHISKNAHLGIADELLKQISSKETAHDTTTSR